MRFLNPKTDYAFKKIFGSEASQDIVISFLNAILDLTGQDRIVGVTILDPRLAPKIDGMKDTYLDVRVRDHQGRSYIVEMQVLNVEGFEKRVLYNACKAYVNQLGKGDPYHILTEVVAVTITDFVMFPDLDRVVSRFRLRADENPLIHHRDLELVFAELPKFTKTEAELETTLDRWLTFLKTAKTLTAVPMSLSVEAAIVHAFDIANRAGWTEDELEVIEKRESWLADQRYIEQKRRETTERAEKALLAQEQAETVLKEREMVLKETETVLKETETALKERETVLKETETALKGTETALKETEAALKGTETVLKETEAALKGTETVLKETETALKERETALKETETVLKESELALREEKQKSEQVKNEFEQKAQKARLEGETKGEAEMLLRLLRRRYQALPDDIEDRIRRAPRDQLDMWSDRFVDARHWDDIFR